MKTCFRLATAFALAIHCRQAAAVSALEEPRWIYYADNDLGTVSRLKLDGSSPELLADPGRSPGGLALDAVNKKLYWNYGGSATFSGWRITRANLDGSGTETFYEVASGVAENISKVAVDMVHSRLYWSDSAGGRILSRDFAGGPLDVILDLPSSFDGALEVDPSRGHIYFTTGSFDARTAKIERVNFDGSDRRVIANTYAASMGLDLVNQRIYAADWNAHSIQRVNFDGTGLTTVIPRVIAPRDVQVFGDKIYFVNYLSEAPDGTGPFQFQWVRTSLDGTNREVLWQVPRLQGPHDMIQFALFVPEPSGIAMFTLVFATIAALQKRSARSAQSFAASSQVEN